MTSWSSEYFSTEPSVWSAVSAVRVSTPSRSSADTQSIASAIPGGFWMSDLRIRETALATWTVRTCDACLTRRRTISTSRLGPG